MVGSTEVRTISVSSVGSCWDPAAGGVGVEQEATEATERGALPHVARVKRGDDAISLEVGGVEGEEMRDAVGFHEQESHALSPPRSMALHRAAQGPRSTGNTVFVITPYRKRGTWVFDDPTRELKAEPFVKGVPAILRELVAHIPDARKGFRLTFSARPFPGYDLAAERAEAEAGGFWYHVRESDKRGWLCPALFKYFPKAPKMLYVRADNRGGADGSSPNLRRGRGGGRSDMTNTKRISKCGGKMI